MDGWHHMLGGVIGGGASCFLFYPLQIAQTRLQVNNIARGNPNLHTNATAHSRPILATRLRDILHESGQPRLRSLYQGLHSAMVATTVAWGSYFWLYSHSKTLWRQHIDDSHPLPALAHLACGFEAGALTCFVANPFFVINTRMQLQSLSASPSSPSLATSSPLPPASHQHQQRYRGLFDAIRTISAQEGLSGFYRGLIPSLFGVVQGAFQFMFFEEIKSFLLLHHLPFPLSFSPSPSSPSPFPSRDRDRDDRSSILVHNPFETDVITSIARTSAEDQDRSLDHTTEGEEEGGFVSPSLALATSLIVLRNKDSLSIVEALVAGSVSKTLAFVLTYPYQVIKSRLQIRPSVDGVPAYSGLRDVVSKTWQFEGFRGFFRGCLLGVVRSAPASAVTFATYELIVSRSSPSSPSS